MENWMKSKGNPYVVGVKRSCPYKKNKAHFGKPIQLFKDSDKDGVANVFDCKPYNKRKQDVLSPLTGGNPMSEMFGRQEAARQQAQYMRLYNEQLQQQEVAQQNFLKDINKALQPGDSGESDMGYAREQLSRQGKFINAQGELQDIQGWTPKISGGMISRSSGSNFAVTTKNPPKQDTSSKSGVWMGGKFIPNNSVKESVKITSTPAQKLSSVKMASTSYSAKSGVRK